MIKERIKRAEERYYNTLNRDYNNIKNEDNGQSNKKKITERTNKKRTLKRKILNQKIIGIKVLYPQIIEYPSVQEFKKQIMWLAISIPIMIILTFVDYNTISKISPILYGLMIISLIAVLFTKSVNGATSWFTIGSVSIQPAEFAKIIAIISLSTYVAKIQEKTDIAKQIICEIQIKDKKCALFLFFICSFNFLC